MPTFSRTFCSFRTFPSGRAGWLLYCTLGFSFAVHTMVATVGLTLGALTESIFAKLQDPAHQPCKSINHTYVSSQQMTSQFCDGLFKYRLVDKPLVITNK